MVVVVRWPVGRAAEGCVASVGCLRRSLVARRRSVGEVPWRPAVAAAVGPGTPGRGYVTVRSAKEMANHIGKVHIDLQRLKCADRLDSLQRKNHSTLSATTRYYGYSGTNSSVVRALQNWPCNIDQRQKLKYFRHITGSHNGLKNTMLGENHGSEKNQKQTLMKTTI